MRKSVPQPQKHCCRDCDNATDFHEIGADGKPFLCKCPYEEWSQFLDIPKICIHFKKTINHG